MGSSKELAQTYNTRGRVDRYEAVVEYSKYRTKYEHSQLGSHAVSTRIDIPRGRVDAWMNGSKPDSLKGIETAHEHGWLDCDPTSDDKTFAAINRLVASVFSGRSISEQTFSPSFSAPDDVEQQLRDDLETPGVGCQAVLSNSKSIKELRPATNGSVFGRLLVVLGAPQGPKVETVSSLPTYLDMASDTVRHEFVRVYVTNRGVNLNERELIQIIEQRPSGYLDELAALIQLVIGKPVSRGKHSIRFSDNALVALNSK